MDPKIELYALLDNPLQADFDAIAEELLLWQDAIDQFGLALIALYKFVERDRNAEYDTDGTDELGDGIDGFDVDAH